MVRPRKVSGLPAGPVCPVVSGTLAVPVGIGRVLGAAVAPGRVVAVAAVVTVGTGSVVEESTRAGPDPPHAVTAKAVATVRRATATLERRPAKQAPRALYTGFAPEPLSSPP
jgi:hypothetical protein